MSLRPESVAVWRERIQNALNAIEPLEGASVKELQQYLDLVATGYRAASDLLYTATDIEEMALEEDREIFEKRFQRVSDRKRAIENGDT